MMTLIRDVWTSFLLGALGALVLLCIGLFIYNGLTPSTTREIAGTDIHNTARPPQSGAALGGHWHGDEWHDAPHTPPSKNRSGQTKNNAQQNRTRKDFYPILPINSPAPPPQHFQTDVQTRINQIYQEMIAAGSLYEMRNGRLEITEAAHKKKYEILVGDMEPENAVAFLEMHGIYNPIILNKLEPRRAIDYLYKVRARQKDREAYARSVLGRDPGNSDAQMVLLSVEPDNAIAAIGYRDIIKRDPVNLRALNRLGYRLHYDYPEEAIHYLKKMNSLDSTRGFYELVLAHERLGNLKTAWLYYRKQQTIQNGNLVVLHKRSIEMGKPLYKQISYTSSPLLKSDEMLMDIGEMNHEETFAPISEKTLWNSAPPHEDHPSENQLTNKKNRNSAGAEAARAEFHRQQKEFLRQQDGAQQEFEEFFKWAESLMNAEEPIDPYDFLAKEFTAHLKGKDTQFSPERTIRAYEMIERYGPDEGFQRLKEKDPELAEQMERLIEEKRPPRRTNSKNRK